MEIREICDCVKSPEVQVLVQKAESSIQLKRSLNLFIPVEYKLQSDIGDVLMSIKKGVDAYIFKENLEELKEIFKEYEFIDTGRAATRIIVLVKIQSIEKKKVFTQK